MEHADQVGTYVSDGVLGPVAGFGGGEFEGQVALLGERGAGTYTETCQSGDRVSLSKNETCVC